MKCPACGLDNKKTSKFCSQCGTGLAAASTTKPKAAAADTREISATDVSADLWRPDWKWHLRTLAIIYAILCVAFLGISRFLSKVPEPYRMRDIPKEMTPWLKR
jgi:uncharacterized membrane protein YvbJ